jgi:hypothetical protein
VRAAAGQSMRMLQSLEGYKCRSAFESFSRSSARPSALQRQVAAELKAAGWAVEEEVVEPLGGYSVDMVVCSCDDLQSDAASSSPLASIREGGPELGWRTSSLVLVEVDGPYHFACGSQRPLGSTVMKRRCAALHSKLHGCPCFEGR